LKPSGHIDAVAVDGAVGLLHHIAEMKAKSKAQAAIFWNGVRACLEFMLDGERSNSRTGGGSRRSSTPSRPLYRRLGHHWRHPSSEGLACGVERFDRAAVVYRHQPRVRDRIRREDGRESKTKFLRPHRRILTDSSAVRHSVQCLSRSGGESRLARVPDISSPP